MRLLCPSGLPGGWEAVSTNEKRTSSGGCCHHRWRWGLQNRILGGGEAQPEHGCLPDAVPVVRGLSGLQHIEQTLWHHADAMFVLGAASSAQPWRQLLPQWSLPGKLFTHCERDWKRYRDKWWLERLGPVGAVQQRLWGWNPNPGSDLSVSTGGIVPMRGCGGGGPAL